MLALLTNEMMTAILRTIDEAIHAVDHRGVTIFYNEAAARHDGLSDHDVLGKHVLEVFPSLTKETSTLLQVLETGKPIVQKPQRYQNVKGQSVDAINTTIPIFLDGILAGAVEISKDYSTVRQLSERVLELQSYGSGRKHPGTYTMADILTCDSVVLKAKWQAEKAAAAHSSVFVYGETGTGKEMFVQAMHDLSPRRTKPLIAQNCAALPESLLESLLFGTTKGSYTGAVDKAGLFEQADGGTLFLDELNSMPLELQAKLLRVLEDGIIRRIGDTRTRTVNVRIIAAMNESPLHCLHEGTLRPDIYYRLNVLSLSIPPLRERKHDIELLTAHFLQEFNRRFFKQIRSIEPEVLQLFRQYPWPGNVRELKHTLEHAMIMADGHILTAGHLPLQLQQIDRSIRQLQGPVPLRNAVEEVERTLIQQALEQTKGHLQQAADLLEIPRQTLQYKLQKYRIVYLAAPLG